METLRATPYDADNLVHEQQLLQLWSLLQPGTVIQNKEIKIRIERCNYIHSACISFWITKRQAISTDTSFETKMMVKSGAIEIIFKSLEPFQSYLLTGQAESSKKAG